jgi:hypothetical protein
MSCIDIFVRNSKINSNEGMMHGIELKDLSNDIQGVCIKNGT